MAAVTAIGKCGMTLYRERILVPLAAEAKGPEAVRAAAVLALGFHVPAGRSKAAGRVASRRALIDNLADRKAPDERRVRAAIALGLRGVAVEKVRGALLAAAGDPKLDVRAAAILAVGLTGDPAVPATLVTWLGTSKIGERQLDDRDLSFVAWAAGLTGDPTVALALAAAAADGDLHTRRAAILALGRVAAGPRESIAVLSKEKDRVARNFALVSLARIGARHADRARAASKALSLAWDRPDEHERAYAAIAPGLLVHSGAIRQREIRTKALAAIPLVSGFPKAEEDHLRGAMHLARGLLGNREDARYLYYLSQVGGSSKDGRFLARTRAAGAIGATLLGIQANHLDRGIEVEVARLCGIDHSSDVARVIPTPGRAGILDPDTNRFVLGGLVQGVGFVSDGDGAEPMPDILADPKSPARARAAAAHALGEIGDPHLAPVLTRLWTDANYPALTPTLRALADLL